MRLSDPAGSSLELTVTGYQFPDAVEPAKKNSWHMVEGEATCAGERWTFRYPALTVDETPRLSAWLRDVAGWIDASGTERGNRASMPAPLSFTEPNLAFRVGPTPDLNFPVVEIELQQEFRRHRGSPTPFDTLHITSGADDLRRAAAEWDAGWAPYPDELV